MGTAIILGIPVGYVGPAKSAISRNLGMFGAWSIKFVPAPRRETAILPRMVDQVMEFAARYDDSHILGLSAQANRQEIGNHIRRFFRFRWFRHELLRFLGSPDPAPFLNGLASDLGEESDWDTRVKPRGLTSPLLLPESSFVVSGRHRDLWRHALAYGDPENVVGAERAIEEFQVVYRRKVERRTFSAYRWVDNGSRVFGQDGPRHARAPFPRDWKYSYHLEFGFHFDVNHLDGRQFTLLGVDGRRVEVDAGKHCNVDPHGYLRF